jgi:hypothetical protein
MRKDPSPKEVMPFDLWNENEAGWSNCVGKKMRPPAITNSWGLTAGRGDLEPVVLGQHALFAIAAPR